MVHPLQYCSGAKELDQFLETLTSNFGSHKHLVLRGDPNQSKYEIPFLDSWNHHPDPTQRHPEETNLSEWASDIREARDTC